MSTKDYKINTENNTLIAEFMQKGSENFNIYDFNGCHIKLEDLKFHTSLDWLIPVIHKLENIRQHAKDDDTGIDDAKDLVDNSLKQADITQTYNAVLSMINYIIKENEFEISISAEMDRTPDLLMDWSNVHEVIKMALLEAERKFEDDKLINTNDLDSEEKLNNFQYGDPETVYSIISTYTDNKYNKDGAWDKQIEAALKEKYPTHF